MTTFGIYEKALPKGISWQERLELAASLGFDFVEMSIDETDERLARLQWTDQEIEAVNQAQRSTGVRIYSICLSGHRRYPFGSADPAKRQKEVKMAAAKQVMLSIEIMDDPFINSLSKFMEIKQQIKSPWLQAYPDLGNLSAWPENNPGYELEKGIDHIVAVHVKDTKNVTPDFPGQFKCVPWGEGDVDFLGCLKTLKRLGYEGTFLFEMWSETDDQPAERIKEAQAFLKPIFEEAGY